MAVEVAASAAEGGTAGGTSTNTQPLGVAVIGTGYWGRNLVRNFLNHPGCELRWVCDTEAPRARAVIGNRSEVRVATSIAEVLADERVSAVAVCTPPGTHFDLGMS
jgi:predicted dehydrogenase